MKTLTAVVAVCVFAGGGTLAAASIRGVSAPGPQSCPAAVARVVNYAGLTFKIVAGASKLDQDALRAIHAYQAGDFATALEYANAHDQLRRQLHAQSQVFVAQTKQLAPALGACEAWDKVISRKVTSEAQQISKLQSQLAEAQSGALGGIESMGVSGIASNIFPDFAAWWKQQGGSVSEYTDSSTGYGSFNFQCDSCVPTG